MFRESIVGSHVAVAEGIFSSVQSLEPSIVWKVFTGEHRREISEMAAKKAHCWGEAGLPVRRVSVLQEGTPEGVRVKGATFPSVACQEAFHGFHPKFCPAVAVGEGDGGEPVVDIPVAQ